jgi:glycosyltransferase involved in cell wall biosynthesis
MRVLVVTALFPPDHGGPATYVPRIAAALQERGHEVAVIALGDKAFEESYPFRVVRIPRSMPRPLRVLRTIGEIWRRCGGADVVYLNGLALEGIVAAKVLRRRRAVVKVVGDLIWERARNQGATAEDLDAFQAARQPAKWRFLRRLQGWYTGKADAVITPSRYLAGVVRGWGVEARRIHVVHNAAETAGAGEERVKRYDLVTVARLVPWKGLEELVGLAAAAGWSLRIVGEGPLRPVLERRVREAGAGGRISLAGHVGREQVPAEILKAKVFVLNSRYEGLPHVVLEAMALGVPVVATAAGGTPEALRDTLEGYLVPVGDTGLLRSRLAELLADEALRKRLGNAGRQGVQERFSLESMVRETEAVLRAAAA